MLDDNEKVILFSLLSENNSVTNRAFLYAFNGNFLKASMLSRYTHCFLKNNNQEITYKDKTFEEQYYCSEKSIKRAKKELKDEGWVKTQYVMSQKREIIQRNIYLNPKPEINNICERINESDFHGHLSRSAGGYPSWHGGGIRPGTEVYNIVEDINNIEKENILPKTGFGDVENSSLKIKKETVVDDWKNNEAFTRLWYSLPEYMRRKPRKRCIKI